ncbi:hypothetical protein FBUS_04839 [Fasciolopsis buskii]|uniref:Uncharacterized protein n=1 Tax=Fasciolopsis buskii TaxID=27845 RepID=A0A8E0S3I4_9TREM|nr:hypothetical protein FBUS_04839 [Fasciolopsis buski]
MHSYATTTNTMYPSGSVPSGTAHFRQVGAGSSVPASKDAIGQETIPITSAGTVATNAIGASVNSTGLISSSILQPHHYYSMLPNGSVDPNLNAVGLETTPGYTVADHFAGRYAAEPDASSAVPIPMSETESMHPSGLPSYAAATQRVHPAHGPQAPNPYYYGYAAT